MNTARRYLPDGLLALALLALGLIGTAPAGRNQGIPSISDWAYALVITAAVALAARRLLPLTVLAITTVAVCLYLLGGYPFGPILLSLAIGMYSVAAHRPLRPAAIAAAVSLALLIFAGLLGAGLGMEAVAPQVAWIAGPLAIGVTVRVGREQVLQHRRDEARRQADAERLRVAQEVHDVVGHGLSAILMQADIALHLLPKQPEQAEAALTAISRTSRESLDELRATLGAVRRGDDADDRSPAPGLARLDALVDRTRAVGVPVAVELAGPLSSLPAAVDLAAYRIVQESLTNVLRHAGTATASVSLALTGNALRISISDTGRGCPSPRAPRDHPQDHSRSRDRDHSQGRDRDRTQDGDHPHGRERAQDRDHLHGRTQDHDDPHGREGAHDRDHPHGHSRARGGDRLQGPEYNDSHDHPPGHGIAGMWERATALGGSLAAGPRPEGGFAVTATLPVRR